MKTCIAALFGGIVCFSLIGCVPRSVQNRANLLSSRADFIRTNTSDHLLLTENLPFVQYIKDSASAKDKELIERVEPKKHVSDSTHHTYIAMSRGLKICAPLESQIQKRSLKISFVKFAIHIVDFFESLKGEDAFGKLVEGSDGCIVLNGAAGLPYEKLTSVALNTEGDILLGSERGAMLLKNGKFYYFSGQRWLDDDFVVNALFDEHGNFIVKTKTGISKIVPTLLTLKSKESYYQTIMKKHRRYGFVAKTANGKISSSDNDGLWTALYVGAESFHYAATGNVDVHHNASESLHALLFLEQVTGVPGLFARSAVSVGEDVNYNRQSADWHASTTYPGWIWKGRASYDELVGHFFAYSVYYDFVANDSEKQEIRDTVNRIADRLLQYRFNIVDKDGNATGYGEGSPEYTRERPLEFLGRGALSLGTLSVLKIMAHITDRDDIRAITMQLIDKYGYALNTYNAKILVSWGVNHSDDQLAWLSYFNLIRLEENPDLRRLCFLSIERYWQSEYQEHIPLWNIIYCAATGNACDIDAALQTLRDMPMDLRNWRMENSQRTDIVPDSIRGRNNTLQSTSVLSSAERTVGRWNNNPYALDMGGDGNTEEEASMWLLPYWMGKYYHLF